MSSNKRVRSPRDCSNDIHQLLGFYSAAAVAAGVGFLALAQPALGEVVVTHKTLYLGNGSDGSPPVTIDFNNDGAVDISFQQNSYGYGYGYAGAEAFVLRPPAGAGVVVKGIGSRGPYVAALLRGAQIGPSAHFNAQSDVIERTYQQTSNGFSHCGINRKLYGHFPGNVPDRFVGVKFLIDGATHYGWVRISVDTTFDNGCQMRTKVTAFAYETVANQKITIGATSSGGSETPSEKASGSVGRPSLGMLASGADGLVLWRKEKEPLLH